MRFLFGYCDYAVSVYPAAGKGCAGDVPFGSMRNVALRVYSGSLAGGEALRAIWLQIFWIAALCFVGGAVLQEGGTENRSTGGVSMKEMCFDSYI